ncbi:MAG TPA: non-homologous end-joining DNA ligase [Chthoniobacteraceae bacterium]|nr:non-homologous end-joining DNA ligase [Chthoniobacteraceae bacterium]
MALKEYRRKRDFSKTAEPSPGKPAPSHRKERRFSVQKHAASRLHFDLRLELGGALVSWAVPKGIPLRHAEKRLAVKVEDHPLAYLEFEGTIPKGEYGGGTVQLWDRGTFTPATRRPLQDLKEGKLHFTLHGEKLHGEWYLVRFREGENQWLLIRGGDDHPALSGSAEARSVASGKTVDEIAAAPTTTPDPAVPFVAPMLAKPLDEPPARGKWSYELKLDGYRVIACADGDRVELLSRNEKGLTARFPKVAAALRRLKLKKTVLDGEVVALDAKGRPSFALLQALEEKRPPLCYYLFDLPCLKGRQLYDLPLEERKEKLRALLAGAPDPLRFGASLGSDAEAVLAKVRELGLEGVIGKQVGSPYEPGRRSGAWIKLKVINEQEFVIGGYTPPHGSRTAFGALLAGVYEEGKLRYCGKVGTGFNEKTLRDLHRRMKALRQDAPAFDPPPPVGKGRYGQGFTRAELAACRWIAPRLIAQIRFTEWTHDGRLRHPVYLGLRDDKEPERVTRETTHLSDLP